MSHVSVCEVPQHEIERHLPKTAGRRVATNSQVLRKPRSTSHGDTFVSHVAACEAPQHEKEKRPQKTAGRRVASNSQVPRKPHSTSHADTFASFVSICEVQQGPSPRTRGRARPPCRICEVQQDSSPHTRSPENPCRIRKARQGPRMQDSTKSCYCTALARQAATKGRCRGRR